MIPREAFTGAPKRSARRSLTAPRPRLGPKAPTMRSTRVDDRPLVRCLDARLGVIGGTPERPSGPAVSASGSHTSPDDQGDMTLGRW